MENAQTALFRVIGTTPQPTWIHRSQRKNTVKLRRWFSTGALADDFGWEPAQTYRLPDDAAKLDDALRGADEFSLAEIAARTQDATLTPAHQIPIESVDKWRLIFERLAELPTSPRGHASAATAASPRSMITHSDLPLIPLTRMRRFYDTLRTIGTKAVEEILVKQFEDRGAKGWDILSTYFCESVTHFSRYDITRYPSAEDAFRPAGRSSQMAEYRDRPEQFAKCLAIRLHNGWHAVERWDADINGVDYEISPFRTTGHAAFEDGKVSTSGGGGLDLLLCDRAGRLLIGEVKAPTDRSLFFAFVQALTYAIELTSKPQAERLKRAYPEQFSGLQIGPAGCRCDIMLFYKAGDEPKFRKETATLARNLVSEGRVGQIIERVAIVAATLNGEGVQMQSVDTITRDIDQADGRFSFAGNRSN